MNRNKLAGVVLALAVAGCSGGFEKGENGLLYKIHENKEGANIKDGDFISVQVVAKTDGDSVLFNSYEMGRASQLMVPKSMYKGDLYSAIEMLSEGDSATFKINADTLAKKTGQPKPNAKMKEIVYTMKVEKVIPKGKMNDQEFQAKIGDFFKAEADKSRKEEPVKMNAYISRNGLKVSKTASGLQYEIVKQGTGEKPAVGDTVKVNYTGRLLTGNVFDTSIQDTAKKHNKLDPMRKYEPIRFPVGKMQVIKGWDEALLLMPKGSVAKLVVPSSLGYGEQGMGPIPPFSTLVFDVELLDIIKPKEGGSAPVAAAPGVKP
ncbi:MAG: FKBP-type peptidyl-prolyl cis-trans isomerase [Mucilaginibacter polytrichastri]|nr:FKBP-type peptidyl-prolyl cis-trans isomerase [Mucilaginibacter polytrichastri]